MADDSPAEPDDEPVPRIPRGRGLKLSTPQIIRIFFVAVTLIALIVLMKPCSRAVSGFVTGFGEPDAAVRIPDARLEGEILRSDMTAEEIKAAVEREQARARAAEADAAVPTPPRP